MVALLYWLHAWAGKLLLGLLVLIAFGLIGLFFWRALNDPPDPARNSPQIENRGR
jgi:hypothetical protein